MGFAIYLEPEGGMFIWVKLNDGINMDTLAAQAAREGVMLAPGNVFRPHQEPSQWLRFNVAHCENEATFEILSRIVGGNSA
jgi:DNA-binding transcriptional MocR family regulator